MGCLICSAVLYGLPFLCAAAVLAWKNSPRAKALIKFSLYAVLSVVAATLPIPLMLLRPKSSKNALFPAACLRVFARYVLGVEFTVKGKEHIAKDTGCVIVINHQSVVDLIVLAELWPIIDRCTVISKKEIFYIWPFGLAAWLWGTIYIDRLNGARAKDSINNTGTLIRERKHRVLMFPEGTRSLKDQLLPFKKGAFHLAVASQCPIQPVVVEKYHFLGKHRFDSGRIDIEILPVIPTEGLSSENLPEVIDKTYRIMQDQLDLMSSKHDACAPNNNVVNSKHALD